MLEEAIWIIRKLWEGTMTRESGTYYEVVDAKLYSLPDEPPPVLIAGSGERSAEMAGRLGDGFIGLQPDPSLIAAFDRAGGAGKPHYAEVQVCWAEDERAARRTATDWWPNAVTPGELVAELPLPRHFEQDATRTDESDIAKAVVCGPDPEAHIARIRDTCTRATTTCGFTRSARISKESSGSVSSRCSRSSARSNVRQSPQALRCGQPAGVGPGATRLVNGVGGRNYRLSSRDHI